jgi:hypothetical protein
LFDWISDAGMTSIMAIRRGREGDERKAARIKALGTIRKKCKIMMLEPWKL